MVKRFGLSGSTLKILACVFMLCDHIGSRLFPQYRLLRIVGRLAFPIFAFCVAQGCRYTRHKGRHFALVFGFGVVWEALLIYYHGEWDGNIFLTFSLSILLIYLWQWLKKLMCRRSIWVVCLSLVMMSAVIIGVWHLAERLHFEYRFFGILAAPMVACFDYEDGQAPRWMKTFDNTPFKLLMLSVALFLLAQSSLGKTVQMYALLAVPLLALYDGTAGNRRLKYMFYMFYPLHLMIIEWIRVCR